MSSLTKLLAQQQAEKKAAKQEPELTTIKSFDGIEVIPSHDADDTVSQPLERLRFSTDSYEPAQSFHHRSTSVSSSVVAPLSIGSNAPPVKAPLSSSFQRTPSINSSNLSSSIPYSVPNQNPVNDAQPVMYASSLTKDSAMPHNIAAIDSNFISSPKVDNIEPRFIISKSKLQERQAAGSVGRSGSFSSQIGSFFGRSSNKREISTTPSGSTLSNYSASVPKPIRARRSSVYSGSSGSSRNEIVGSYDSFIGSPSSFHEQTPNQYIPRSRQSSVADLKRFFKKSSPSNQNQYLPPQPSSLPKSNPISESPGNSISQYTTNPTTIPFSKRYSKPVENLGAGAGGSVRLVNRLSDNKVVAVKEFRARYPSETKREYAKKITSEYCIGTTLRHQNIIETIEIAYENDHIYQVMEYCDYDLFAIVMSNKMAYEEICCCFKQILNGVQYLHSIGLAHRDLKLDNCVINAQGIVKLIDFGAAVVFSYPFSKTLVEAAGIVGSDPYLAPEVCIFTKYDPRPVDIWSVAIIFSCMVLKKFPWKIPKLSDNSFKLFCSGRNSDSLSALIKRTPEPPTYNGHTEATGHTDSSDPNNTNIGVMRLLHSLPEECHTIIGRMVDLAPACRATIDEVMSDPWIEQIDHCIVIEEEDFNGVMSHHVKPGMSHDHTQVDQSEAHIASLEKKKKEKK